jgi:hypothetical protein
VELHLPGEDGITFISFNSAKEIQRFINCLEAAKRRRKKKEPSIVAVGPSGSKAALRAKAIEFKKNYKRNPLSVKGFESFILEKDEQITFTFSSKKNSWM